MAHDYFFPVDRADAGEEIWAQISDEFFIATQRIRLTPIDVDFRVVSGTGIVWGWVQTLTELKDGRREVVNLRLTATFVNQDQRPLAFAELAERHSPRGQPFSRL